MQEINIKEEAYKCSKCGLCQGVCPLFLATKNEMYLARGRFNVLNNFFNNNIPLSKKFIKELDICLYCNACQKFCPSSINSSEIFMSLKNRYAKPSLFIYKLKLILLMHSIKKFFIKNQLYKVKIQETKSVCAPKIADVVYFQGCFNKYINPSDKNASLKLLKQEGYNVVQISNYCCGLPYLTEGDFKNFDKNIEKIKKSIPKNAKYIITSCDSCFQTLYKAFKDTDIKLIKIDDIIISAKTTKNALFYQPFSREKYTGMLQTLNKKGSCSLNENYFMIKHPKIAQKLLNSVFYKKEETEGKTIVTSCNLSKWGLIEGFRKKGINSQVVSLSEYFVENQG